MICTIQNAVLETYGINHSELIGRCKKGLLPEARRMYCLLLSERDLHPARIAKIVHRHRSHVSRSLKKMKFEIDTYDNQQKTYKRIEMNIHKQQLEKEKHELEQWLKNNEHCDWRVRHDKIKRITEIDKELTQY